MPSKYLQGPALRGQHQPTFVLCAAPPPRPSFEEILQSLEELRAAEGGATTRLEVRNLPGHAQCADTTGMWGLVKANSVFFSKPPGGPLDPVRWRSKRGPRQLQGRGRGRLSPPPPRNGRRGHSRPLPPATRRTRAPW